MGRSMELFQDRKEYAASANQALTPKQPLQMSPWVMNQGNMEAASGGTLYPLKIAYESKQKART